jgi:hypothetical protein
MIVFNSQPCTMEEENWNAFQSTFNNAQDRPFDMACLDQSLPQSHTREWKPFSEHELKEVLSGCNGNSASGPDHIT